MYFRVFEHVVVHSVFPVKYVPTLASKSTAQNTHTCVFEIVLVNRFVCSHNRSKLATEASKTHRRCRSAGSSWDLKSYHFEGNLSGAFEMMHNARQARPERDSEQSYDYRSQRQWMTWTRGEEGGGLFRYVPPSSERVTVHSVFLPSSISTVSRYQLVGVLCKTRTVCSKTCWRTTLFVPINRPKLTTEASRTDRQSQLDGSTWNLNSSRFEGNLSSAFEMVHHALRKDPSATVNSHTVIAPKANEWSQRTPNVITYLHNAL